MREVLYLTLLVCISAVYYGGDYVYDYADPGAADILGPYPQDYYEDRQLRSRDIDEDPSELVAPSPGDDDEQIFQPRESNRQVERDCCQILVLFLFLILLLLSTVLLDQDTLETLGEEEERRRGGEKYVLC